MTGVYYKQNRLKKLRAFCQTAKLGSVTKAAEKLFASQPTVSLQIQALEREIGKQLSISARTVQVHLSNVFGKLGVGSRTEAVLYAVRQGWLSLQDVC